MNLRHLLFALALCAPLAQPALAQNASAQTFSTPAATPADVAAAQAAAQNYSDTQLANFTPTDAFLTNGATRMGGLGVVANSVNGSAGSVSLPTYVRQQTPVALTPDGNGNVTFTFAPTPAFKTPPGCYAQITTTTTGWSFLFPVTTAISTSAVTMNVRAAPNTLTINTLGASLPLSQPAPSGTAVSIICFAPN